MAPKTNSDNRNKPCPFCELDNTASVFADEGGFLAICNIAPILPGHSLVIPKRHVESFLELDEQALAAMVSFSRRVSQAVLMAFDAKSFNWTIQEGEAAGQSVSHLHLHIIPRITGDLPSPGDWYPRLKERQNEVIDSDARERLTGPELEAMVTRLRRAYKEVVASNQPAPR